MHAAKVPGSLEDFTHTPVNCLRWNDYIDIIWSWKHKEVYLVDPKYRNSESVLEFVVLIILEDMKID